jgi:two-component system response regulator YesN
VFKVILIDDEVLVRVGLKSLINWEKHGYQIIAEASNGQDALTKIKAQKPDIVIIDIKMPVKDGLELIEEVNKLQLQTKFIVLSSYDDFKLVKQALQLGAVDYLLKLELESEQLLNCLNTARKAIKKQQKSEREIDHSRLHLPSLLELRTSTFKKIINKQLVNQNEIKRLFKKLEIDLVESRLYCLVIRLKNIDQVQNNDSQGEQLFESSVLNIVREIVSDFYPAHVFSYNWGEIICFFSLEPDQLLNQQEEVIPNFKNLTVRLTKMMREYFDVEIELAVSNSKNKFFELSTAFQEAVQALQYSFQCPAGQAVYYKDLAKYKTRSTSKADLKIFIDRFAAGLEKLNYSDLKDNFKQLTKKLKTENISARECYSLCFEILFIIRTKLSGRLADKILTKQANFYQQLLRINNIADLFNWLNSLDQQLQQVLIEQEDNNHLVTKAKNYIKQNYKKEITLDQLAEKLNVSYGYLSVLFKEKVGLSFSEYLNEVKITAAKQMLTESDCKIYTVAYEVGYNNPYYFSRVFKQKTGLTPRQYRKRYYC